MATRPSRVASALSWALVLGLTVASGSDSDSGTATEQPDLVLFCPASAMVILARRSGFSGAFESCAVHVGSGITAQGASVPPSPPLAAVPAVNVAVATATRTTVAAVRPVMSAPFEVGPAGARV